MTCNYVDTINNFKCFVRPRNGAPFCSKHKPKINNDEIKKSLEINETPYLINCFEKDSENKIKFDKNLWLHTKIFDKIIEKYLYTMDHDERIYHLKKYAQEYGCPCTHL